MLFNPPLKQMVSGTELLIGVDVAILRPTIHARVYELLAESMASLAEASWMLGWQ